MGPGAGAQGGRVGPEALLQVVHGQRPLGRRGLLIGEAHAGGLGENGEIIRHSKDVDTLKAKHGIASGSVRERATLLGRTQWGVK